LAWVNPNRSIVLFHSQNELSCVLHISYNIIHNHKILSQKNDTHRQREREKEKEKEKESACISFMRGNWLLWSSFFVSHLKLANKLEIGYELQSHGSPHG
jgi:hypothetical protein